MTSFNLCFKRGNIWVHLHFTGGLTALRNSQQSGAGAVAQNQVVPLAWMHVVGDHLVHSFVCDSAYKQ